MRFFFLIAVLLFSGCATSAQTYLKQHPDTPNDIQNCMLSGQPCVGMNTEQALVSFGPPAFTKYKGQCSQNMSISDFANTALGEKCSVRLAEDMWVYGQWFSTSSGGIVFLYADEKYLFFKDDKLVRIETAKEKNERERKELAEQYFQEHSDRTEFKQSALAKRLKIGMTSDEVELTLGGFPRDTNNTNTAFGVSSQWVYGSIEKYNVKYVYLENGILTSWQD